MKKEMGMLKSHEDYIYLARLAENSERYDDIIKYMKGASKVS